MSNPRWLKLDIVDEQDAVSATLAADVRWDYNHNQGPGVKMTLNQARYLHELLGDLLEEYL